ncbi:MAG: hypothetical protein GF372_00515 [Candidatus Marinimicrobia bacterium]|nr:hypothetical protein [Candidatus Neomarinimicrobiota bacterium]
MDHVVYLDAKAGELNKLLEGSKSMIIRGAAGRKIPYGRVNTGDMLYFMENDGSGEVRARGAVSQVLNSEKMTTEESVSLVEQHQDGLQLTPAQVKRWAGKRYLVLITVADVRQTEPFTVDRSGYGNMDDWLPVGDIQKVRVT